MGSLRYGTRPGRRTGGYHDWEPYADWRANGDIDPRDRVKGLLARSELRVKRGRRCVDVPVRNEDWQGAYDVARKFMDIVHG